MNSTASAPAPQTYDSSSFQNQDHQLRPTPGRSAMEVNDANSGVLTWCVEEVDAESEAEEFMSSGQPLFDRNVASGASADHSSGSAGHSGQDSASAEESTVLGHRTMASLLNSNSGASAPARDSAHPPRSPSPSIPQHHHPRESLDAQSLESNASSSDAYTHASSSNSTPATSARRSTSRGSSVASASAARNSGSVSYDGSKARAPRRRSNSSRSSCSRTPPAHAPPTEKLPELPSNASIKRPGTAESSRSSIKSKNRAPPSTSPTLRSSSESRFSRTSMSSPGPAPASATWTAELSGQEDTDALRTDTETETEQQSPRLSTSTGSSFSSRKPKKSKSKSKSKDSASSPHAGLQSILDDAEKRRKSLMHKSIGGLISALDSEVENWSDNGSGGDNRQKRQSTASTTFSDDTERRPSLSTVASSLETPRSGSTNSALFALYDRASNAHEDGQTNSIRTDSLAERKNHPLPDLPLVEPPAISIDHADSDETISADDDSDLDTPRKKAKQRPQRRHGTKIGVSTGVTGHSSFDDQRAAPLRRPSMPLNAKGSLQTTPSTSAPAEANPFAYYAFSPELPPFVPQGLKPMDLTGRGTWMSIAARAGGLGSNSSPSIGFGSPSVSRVPSQASLGTFANQPPWSPPMATQQDESNPWSSNSPPLSSTGETSTESSRKGGVSMRQLAAQTRARQKQAEEFREQQASLLSQKQWSPFDIHVHAAGFANQLASERGSVGEGSTPGSPMQGDEPRFTRSRQSSHSFSAMSSHLSLRSLAQSDVEGKAFDFGAHAAAWRDYEERSPARRSEASVGGDAAMPFSGLDGTMMRRMNSVSSGYGSEIGERRKEYREFSQQTTPPPSPGPEEQKITLRSEAGVGADEDQSGGVGADSRKAGRRREQIVSSSTIGQESPRQISDDETGNRGQDARSTTPTQRKQLVARRSFRPVGDLEEEDDFSLQTLRTPRLSSRRSNIGTSPLRKSSMPTLNRRSVSGRKSNSPSALPNPVDAAYLAGGETTDAGRGDATSSSSSATESDEDDSGESDLDLATPLHELALKTGAFDAVVQARGSKRKLKEQKGAGGRLMMPGVARPIAGSRRISKSTAVKELSPARKGALAQLGSPPLITESATFDGSPKQADLTSQMNRLSVGQARLAAIKSSAALRRVSSARDLEQSRELNSRILRARKSFAHEAATPERNGAARPSLPARPASPDLEQSFASDMHSDEDEDGDLLLSEMEFPEPATGLGVKLGRGIKSAPNVKSIAHDRGRESPSRGGAPHESAVNLAEASKDRKAAEYEAVAPTPRVTESPPTGDSPLSPAQRAPRNGATLEVLESPDIGSSVDDTPMTNLSSGVWSTLADSNRASTATTISMWSQNSGGSGDRKSRDDLSDVVEEEHLAGKDDPVKVVGEDSGNVVPDAVSSPVPQQPAAFSSASASPATPLKSSLPSKSIQAPSKLATPTPRSSLPGPATSRAPAPASNTSKALSRRPTDPLPATPTAPSTPLNSAPKTATRSVTVTSVNGTATPPGVRSGIPVKGGPASVTPTGLPKSGLPSRIPATPKSGLKAPSALPTGTPQLRKAASSAHLSPANGRRTSNASPGSIDRKATPSPSSNGSVSPGNGPRRYSAASPSMALPDTSQPSGGITRPSSNLSNGQRRMSGDPIQLKAGGTGTGLPSSAIVRRPAERRKSATMSPPPSASPSALPVPRRRPSVHFAPHA